MDASDPRATTVEEYHGRHPALPYRPLCDAAPPWMSHKESIALFDSLGVGMTPELKVPTLAIAFDGGSSRQADLRAERCLLILCRGRHFAEKSVAPVLRLR